MTKIPNFKPVLVIEFWNLIFCNALPFQRFSRAEKVSTAHMQSFMDQIS